MGLRDSQIRLNARGFDTTRRLLQVTEPVYLLQSIENSKLFKSIKTIDAGFIVDFNEWRTQAKLTYATLDQDFWKYVAVTDHFAFEGALYVIPPETRDLSIVQPMLNSPFWQIWANTTGIRYYD